MRHLSLCLLYQLQKCVRRLARTYFDRLALIWYGVIMQIETYLTKHRRDVREQQQISYVKMKLLRSSSCLRHWCVSLCYEGNNHRGIVYRKKKKPWWLHFQHSFTQSSMQSKRIKNWQCCARKQKFLFDFFGCPSNIGYFVTEELISYWLKDKCNGFNVQSGWWRTPSVTVLLWNIILRTLERDLKDQTSFLRW